MSNIKKTVAKKVRCKMFKKNKNLEAVSYECGEWHFDELPSWWAWIYVGGDRGVAERVCREMVFPSGMCVTVEETLYIFAGGTENGVRIGLIQYPRYPDNELNLLEKAISVGKKVAEENYQWSFSVVTPNEIRTYSRRRQAHNNKR